MMHRPYGKDNPNCSCMVDGKCSKEYPRDICDLTIAGFRGIHCLHCQM